MNIAVLGTGSVGRAIAGRLHELGHAVLGWLLGRIGRDEEPVVIFHQRCGIASGLQLDNLCADLAREWLVWYPAIP